MSARASSTSPAPDPVRGRPARDRRRQPPGFYLCAILDVRLRDGEVFPAADRLAQAGVPIIFHSGHADRQGLEDRYPGALVCAKPCAPRTLRARLDDVIQAAG